MTKLEQLKIELDKYEAAHGTTRRHPDGRLESRQIILLIGRTVLELAPKPKPVPLKPAEKWCDPFNKSFWVRGSAPGYLTNDGDQFLWSPFDAPHPRYRAACAALWPDFVLPDT